MKSKKKVNKMKSIDISWFEIFKQNRNKKTHFQKINSIILLLHIIFPIWFIALIYTSNFSGVLLLIVIIMQLLLAIVYKCVKALNKGKVILTITRCLAIFSIIIYYIPMLILMNFTDNKSFYEIKRYDYIYGVYGGYNNFDEIIPKELPIECNNYSFRTEGSMIAQDYHASSYLMFYTTKEQLDIYKTYYDSLNLTRFDNNTEDSESLNYKKDWIYGQMRINESSESNSENIIIYWIKNSYPAAILLNYDTGLVAVVT